MALLKAGPLGVDIRISRVLGDRTARSISGAEYLVNFSSPLGKMTPVVVEDSEPDHFYTAFEDALLSRGPTVHSTIDEQLCFGVYPVEPPEWVLARHTLPCEPADFAGIPEDVFKVVISLNISSKGPLGSGIALVLPLHGQDIKKFLVDWLREIESAPKSADFQGAHLLRWMPTRNET